MPEDTWTAYFTQVFFLVAVFILFKNEIGKTLVLVKEKVIDRKK
ncbi:hypothetical protein SDC9_114360 [bioreactor metagenome]|uniref:Uncharacterized protein n=1 Tax=bioreactor metagenome TaxID=1076179 RepID=A0A645BQP0_9ZZZZ